MYMELHALISVLSADLFGSGVLRVKNNNVRCEAF